MPLYRRSWEKSEGEKVAFVQRGMGQDIGYRLKNETFRKIFPEKFLGEGDDRVDIGEKCCEWGYSIITDLDNNAELQNEMLSILLLVYKSGKNPDTWRPWLDYYLLKLQSLANKIDKMSNIAKMSFMDKLEKETFGADIEEQPW